MQKKFFKSLFFCATILLAIVSSSCSKDDVNKIIDTAKDIFSDESIRQTWELQTKYTEMHGETATLYDTVQCSLLTATTNSEYLKFTNDMYYTQIGYEDGERMYKVGGYIYVSLLGTLKVTIGVQIFNFTVVEITDTKLVTRIEYPYSYIDETTGVTENYTIIEKKIYKTGSASAVDTLLDLFGKVF